MPSTTTTTSSSDEVSAPPPGRRKISWKRVIAPAIVVIIGLFVVGGIAGTLSGKLSSVIENDQAAFLPDSAESTKSVLLEPRFAGAQDIPALIVWERLSGLTDGDLAADGRLARPSGSCSTPR